MEERKQTKAEVLAEKTTNAITIDIVKILRDRNLRKEENRITFINELIDYIMENFEPKLKEKPENSKVEIAEFKADLSGDVREVMFKGKKFKLIVLGTQGLNTIFEVEHGFAKAKFDMQEPISQNPSEFDKRLNKTLEELYNSLYANADK